MAQLVGIAVRVGPAINLEQADGFAVFLDHLGHDVDIRAGIVAEHEIVAAVVGDGGVGARGQIVARDAVVAAVHDLQPRLHDRVVQRGRGLADAAAHAVLVLAADDFGRGLIAVFHRALAGNGVEADALAVLDDQAVEPAAGQLDVGRASFGAAGAATGAPVDAPSSTTTSYTLPFTVMV